MARLIRATSKSRRHLPPGTPVYVGKESPRPALHVIDYTKGEVVDKPIDRVEDCFAYRDRESVTWINVYGLGDAEQIASLGERFGLHPLVQEDILNTDLRPKMEDFGEHIVAVLKMTRWEDAVGEAVTEQVSIVLGKGFVISFQERPGDVFEPIRERIRAGKGRIRGMKADYLAYCLIDAIIDGYFVVLERLSDRLEGLEDRVVNDPSRQTAREIHRLRREGLFFRRAIWPVRELVGGMERAESPLIGKAVRPYLRDAYDHSIQIIDTMETFRELVSGMLDTYLSSLSNRMNEVMKVLTIIATIFIPLTFLAGIYGMNFDPDASPWNMPELGWRYGYPAVLLAMAVVAAGMLLYFRRKKWL